MRHRRNKKTLDRKSASRRALIKGLAIALILSDRIKTTEAKAKILRPYVERLITIGRKNSLVCRRQLLGRLQHTTAVKKIIEVLGPKYLNRSGGYTRIVKLKPRRGDAAKLAIIEFI